MITKQYEQKKVIMTDEFVIAYSYHKMTYYYWFLHFREWAKDLYQQLSAVVEKKF